MKRDLYKTILKVSYYEDKKQIQSQRYEGPDHHSKAYNDQHVKINIKFYGGYLLYLESKYGVSFIRRDDFHAKYNSK